MKYKFKAIYKDGTEYNQNPEDVSISNPLKSCYYDVDQSKLKIFALYNDSTVAAVNLENLSFNINGANILLHEPELSIENIRLIYYRRNKIVFGPQSKNESVTFNIGWQGNINGENIKRIVTLI